MPPVRRFWVMVVNLPPPVPRKTSSSGGEGVIMVGFHLTEVVVVVVNLFSFGVEVAVACKFYFLSVCFI